MTSPSRRSRSFTAEITSAVATVALAAALALTTSPAAQAAVNLLPNGSFEMTSGAPGAVPGMGGWTIVPDYTVTPPGAVTYGTANALFPGGVPLDNAASLSPDPVGNRAFYLIDDASPEAISTVINLPAGHYTAGFDYFVPVPAAGTAADAALWLKIGTGPVWQTTLSSLQHGAWTNVTTSFYLPTSGGAYVIFDTTPYGSSSQPALDVLIDRVYVTAAVPEPSGAALLGAGLAGISWLARRRSARAAGDPAGSSPCHPQAG